MKKKMIDKEVLEEIFKEMDGLRVKARQNSNFLEKGFERYDAMLKVVEMLGYKKECIARMSDHEEF